MLIDKNILHFYAFNFLFSGKSNIWIIRTVNLQLYQQGLFRFKLYSKFQISDSLCYCCSSNSKMIDMSGGLFQISPPNYTINLDILINTVLVLAGQVSPKVSHLIINVTFSLSCPVCLWKRMFSHLFVLGIDADSGKEPLVCYCAENDLVILLSKYVKQKKGLLEKNSGCHL